MKIKKYLVVNQKGTTRISAQMPDLKWDEISILLEMELPNSLFNRPLITAKLAIDESLAQSVEVTVEMKNDIQEAVRQSTGIEMRILDQEA